MKKWMRSAAVSFTVFAGVRPGIAGAQETPLLRNIGNEVRDVFATKCAGCHGPDLAKPKGRFGYVLDLRRIAANPEMVVPLRPTESELWELVQRDEMPPADSPHGALTSAQKEVIGAWIAAGAPDASRVASESSPAAGTEPMIEAPLQMTSADRVFRLLGKFHLLLLHFPIALVVAAGISELWWTWRRNSRPAESVRFCLYLGALIAIPTAGMGWLFAAAGNGVGSPQILTAHRWLGTAAALWLVITAAFVERDARSGVRSRWARLLLATGILITALTAHLGGLLSRGEDFFGY
jgi:uncharacterized membrane protein/mono/diheme cytochrome c family protein